MTTRLERVKLLHNSGYTNAEIATVIGVRSTRTVTRLKRQAGIAPRPARPVTPPEVREQILHLSRDEGWPPEEIAATLDIGWDAAHKWGVRGPGEEWSIVSYRLARRFPALWQELRAGV